MKSFRIKGQGFEDFEVIPQLRFLIRSKYRKWNNYRRSYDRLFTSAEWVSGDELDPKTHYLGMKVNQKSKTPFWNGIDFKWTGQNRIEHKNEISSLLHNKNFWWLMGRYVADGWCGYDRGNVIIAVGKGKMNEFKEYTEGLFHYRITEEQTVSKVVISSKELCLFVEQFGKGAANKKVPKSVKDLPVEYLESFVRGYWSGDGCNNKNGFKTASSVSRELIYGMGACVAKVYKRPYSIYKNIPSPTKVIEGRTVNQKPYYTLRFKEDTRKQDNAFYEDGYIWVPIKKVSE